MSAALPANDEHRYVSLDQMRELVGREAGVSDWLEIGQDRIDAFAEITGDRQFIHIDPLRAADTPIGGTIAHGFYTLSLISWLGIGARPRLRGTVRMVNYGLDRVRFVAPVPSGARIRARFVLASLAETRPNEITQGWDVTVEVEGAARPAIAARWITRAYLDA